MCALGYEGAWNNEGVEYLRQIKAFVFDPWEVNSDASGGIRLGWVAAFGSPEENGRGKWVQCEMHFLKDKENAEIVIPEEKRAEHDYLVRTWLLSLREEEWEKGFDDLQSCYSENLKTTAKALATMRSWLAFWHFR
jgi:hypothetical protein